MRLLQVHNHYRFSAGEDQVVANERNLLERHGHDVIQYTVRNQPLSLVECVAAAKNTIWNHAVYQDIRAVIRRHRPDIAHFHNTFPIISPSAYYAAAAEGTPVVQTLHNYRVVCPAATLFRNGRECKDCLHQRSPLPGLMHSCYRHSRTATAVTAGMIVFHRTIDTWTSAVDTYIAPSEFVRRIFIEAGLPARKIVTKPNFVDPATGPAPGDREDFVLYVGRLTDEKGVRTLLAAWEAAHAPGQLRIAGEGPLAEEVQAAVSRTGSVVWLGQQANMSVRREMARARAVIVPSEWYEPFGGVVIEAYAEGTPVIASDIGALAELILPGRTGLLFRPGDKCELAHKITWALSHSNEMQAMGDLARNEFTRTYNLESNYRQMMAIYSRTLLRMEPASLFKNDDKREYDVLNRESNDMVRYCDMRSQ